MKAIKCILIICFVFFSCENQTTSPERDTNDYSGNMQISLDMSDAPSAVASLRGKLSNSDGDEINFDFSITDNTATALLENIPGGDWLLQVNALDNDNNVLYSGSAEVTVYPGVVTPVSLRLNPATGSLQITVTWGNNSRLVAYYPFKGNANDESNNGHNGEVMGASLATDRFGNENNAYYFDGIDDEIFVGYSSSLDITGDITICAWFKTETPQWGSLVSNFDQHGPDNGYELCVGSLYEDGGFIYFECAYDNARDGFSTTASFDDGQWHFVVATLAPDGNARRRVFVDTIELTGHNNQIGGGPIPAIGATPDYPFKIGAASNRMGPEEAANFKGIIDDVRIYEGVLNQNEIEAFFNLK